MYASVIQTIRGIMINTVCQTSVINTVCDIQCHDLPDYISRTEIE